MFSRKKPEPPKRRNHDLSQFGIMDIPDDFDPSVGYGGADDSNDSDLEAELAAIAGGGGGKPKQKPKAKLVPPTELDKMIAASLKDVGSDDDDDGMDDDDPDLLGELKNIAGDEVELEEEVTSETKTEQPEENPEPQLFMPTTTTDTIGIIRQRLEMYKQAEANAKAAGEGAKARRIGRGLKTLNDLLKQSLAGKSINVDDIPPEVAVKPTSKEDSTTTSPTTDSPPKVPVREAPPLPQTPQSPPSSQSPQTPQSPKSVSPEQDTTTISNSTATISEPLKPTNPLLDQMHARQREYKSAALQSKRSGDTAMALQFLKVVKQFDMVIKMCEDGQEVDLSDMPPPPDQFKEFMEKMQATPAAAPTAETVTIETNTPTPDNTKTAALAEPETTSEPTTILEALQQRLDKYKSVEESAKAEGNSSKARRFGRIVKQYEDAVKLHKAGKQVAYEELPVPPGFGPLPTENNSGQSTTAAPNVVVSSPTSPIVTPKSTNEAVTPTPTPTATPKPVQKRPAPQHQDLTTRTSGNQQKNNLAEQQMKLLLERQKEFKVAAIEAKKAGEIDQAKEYLKIYKGFDALLNAASSGLPVDMSTLPLPPSQRDDLEASFAIVSTEDCDPDISDIGVRIEEQLAKQLMMCKNTRDHHKAMGDVAGMNRFENLALTVQKDLDLVRYSKRKKFPLPKFHYENRSFNIVHCNTDLTDNELEIIIVRGINYNVTNPKDVDTYVKIEFPLLNDEFFRTKTNLIKDTDSPDYDQRFKVDIQRGNRQFQRIFKRHGVKFEVYSRGGFLRSDILIGTVNVKLQPLETKCDLHDTFNLMEGRKAIGGQLEVKIRVRNPILTKQMEHINEKWLILDH